MSPQTETSKKWREENGVLYLSVTSHGKTGRELAGTLKAKGIEFSEIENEIIHSYVLPPEDRGTIEIVVIKGTLFAPTDRTTKKIRAFADERGYTTLDVYVACLIREQFTNEELKQMGLWWIITMHDPVWLCTTQQEVILGASRSGGVPLFQGCNGSFEAEWAEYCGFAFAAPRPLPRFCSLSSDSDCAFSSPRPASFAPSTEEVSRVSPFVEALEAFRLGDLEDF